LVFHDTASLPKSCRLGLSIATTAWLKHVGGNRFISNYIELQLLRSPPLL
jgi:hypothetical protein